MSIWNVGNKQSIFKKIRYQEECIKKLHHLIEEVLKPVKPRKATKPKRSAILKRLDSKERNSKKKQLRSKNYK